MCSILHVVVFINVFVLFEVASWQGCIYERFKNKQLMTVFNVLSCCIRCPGQYGRTIHMLCTVKGTSPYKWRFWIYLDCRVRAVIIVPFINASVRLHSLHNNWNRNLNSFSPAIYLVGQKKLLVVRFKEILWFFSSIDIVKKEKSFIWHYSGIHMQYVTMHL